MGFMEMDSLANDQMFMARVRACSVQQAGTMTDQSPADQQALARDAQMGGTFYLALVRIISTFPGLADGATTPSGTVDQSKITDNDILAQVQANWAHVASLYFNADGTVKPIP